MSSPEPPGARPPALDVWLADEHVGVLDDPGFGYVGLTFTAEALERHGLGSRVLSLSLPMQRDPVAPIDATSFFRGLLPEGTALEQIAERERLSTNDTFGLLNRLGRDCAGGLTILEAGVDPWRDPGELRLLKDGELAQLLLNLPADPLGLDDEGRVRLSLAGAQDKLVVVVGEDGAVGLPLDGLPSSHIMKPPSVRRDGLGSVLFDELVENEAFCMRLAAAAGLSVADIEVRTVDAVRVLVVSRFDRELRDGRRVRIHQEDACQALGIDPLHKYEQSGGPGLAAVAELIRAYSAAPLPDALELLRLTVFNVMIGNADAHGKNVALLHLPGGGIRLAPAYDLVSTAMYPAVSARPAMSLGGAISVDAVDRTALEAAAADCGLPARLAATSIDDLMARVAAALPAVLTTAHTEHWHAPIVDRIAERVAQVRLTL